MKCLHCLVEFHDDASYSALDADVDHMWIVEMQVCPACERLNLYLINCDGESIEHYPININSRIPIHPKGPGRPPCPPQVPATIAADYREACLVLPDSPRASAAISRGAIQKTLRDVAKVPKGNLINEILELIGRNQIPEHLALMLSAVLKVGNFAIYPLKGSQPSSVLAVEPAEASLNLDVLDGLFDFYYVQPAINQRRVKMLEATVKTRPR